ncbi:Glu/Leu/Phe/Val dehydrogenase dimerization domain-containing protein [Streptomyces baarnensis]|uniref:Glu/Leu/Phe/Val dehydrogenase dimerization domain-containing protein n=1 Tax=Streptomyces TaxID=1883 RepID=UPI0029B634EF|nr:Glu/Leu/Phe/Val dehydrogenase dimerization domain-containing protein [Streptomyces sp. ME02-6979.5a]MDX3342666.1 Glu/Leu/Phe/Val dehydrogenase dimerization domain-containing protein [Streptomyces sp. ME02-6979.5a]
MTATASGTRPTAPPRPAQLEVAWTDPVTGHRGFLVIDRLVRGVASGGLRMREGCTLDEVRGLAAGMTRKEALHYDPARRYIPLGGAKGGIDCSPHAPEAPAVLRRFLDGVKPLLREFWTTGEDLGVRQDSIEAAAAAIGLDSTIEAIYPLLDDPAGARARLADAFAVVVDGVPLPELVGGLGVAQSVLTALDHVGIPHGSARAVIQGFGSMGGATARYLAQAGVSVVAVADAHGLVLNEHGLDVERLLLTRDPFGAVDRTQLRPGDVTAGGSAWLDVACEVLVPAALSYCIDLAAQQRITARVVAEAANMPTLPDAEAALHARGVSVLPDFVVNSATNAWWWWTLFGDVAADPEAAHTLVRETMGRLTADMLDAARRDGITPRAAALHVVEHNLADIDARYAVPAAGAPTGR